jgi:hypothetical protein
MELLLLHSEGVVCLAFLTAVHDTAFYRQTFT